MLSPTKRRSSQIVEEDGPAALGTCRRGMGKEQLEGQQKLLVCSFMWAGNLWIMSHFLCHVEQMLKDLIQELERWDLAPKPASFMVEKFDRSIDTKTGRCRFPFEVKKPDPRVCHELSGVDARVPGRMDAKCKQDLVERCEDLQKERCAVDSEVQKDGGTSLSRLLLRK